MASGGVRQLKSILEEKANQRRAHSQRDQILLRLSKHMEGYKEELSRALF